MPLLLGKTQRGIVLAATIHFFHIYILVPFILRTCSSLRWEPIHQAWFCCLFGLVTLTCSLSTSNGLFWSPGDAWRMCHGMMWRRWLLMECQVVEIWSFLMVQMAKHTNPCHLTLTQLVSTIYGFSQSSVDGSNDGLWDVLMWRHFCVFLGCWNLVIFRGAKSKTHKPACEDSDPTNTNESWLILEPLWLLRKMATTWKNETHPSCIVGPPKFRSFSGGKNQNTQTHTTLGKMVLLQFSLFCWMSYH